MSKARITVIAVAAATTLTACAQPAASHPARPAPPASRPAPASQPSKAEWTRINFADYLYGSMDCQASDNTEANTAEITVEKFADLTGDGSNEAIIVGKCITGIGGAPISLHVLEGADTRWPESLLQVGDRDDLAYAEIETEGRTLTITAHGRSATAMNSRPDRLIVESYRWTGDEFERTRRTVDPL